MHNDLVSLSDAEREALIQWNVDAMATAVDRDEAMRHWKRADLLMKGRSMAQQIRLARALRERVAA